MNDVISVDNIGDVLQRLETAFFDIPFENSDFQNRAFVVAAQQTPGRAYRAIGLRMFTKVRAVKDYLIQKERTQIDVEEKQAKIAAPDTSEFDKRRLRLDILQIQDSESWNAKLLNDAVRELNCLYAEFVALPPYTRVQFEAEEASHFQQRLTRALTSGGAAESLLNMNRDLPEWQARIEQFSALLLEDSGHGGL